MPRYKASNSRSKGLYFFSESCSFLLKNASGPQDLLINRWRTAPTAWSEASVASESGTPCQGYVRGVRPQPMFSLFPIASLHVRVLGLLVNASKSGNIKHAAPGINL